MADSDSGREKLKWRPEKGPYCGGEVTSGKRNDHGPDPPGRAIMSTSSSPEGNKQGGR